MPMDGGAWQVAVHGVVKSWTWLSDFTFTFHFHALEKEMATHSSVLAWRIPGTREPGGLPSMRLRRVGHEWSNLAAATAAAAGLNRVFKILSKPCCMQMFYPFREHRQNNIILKGSRIFWMAYEHWLQLKITSCYLSLTRESTCLLTLGNQTLTSPL